MQGVTTEPKNNVWKWAVEFEFFMMNLTIRWNKKSRVELENAVNFNNFIVMNINLRYVELEV